MPFTIIKKVPCRKAYPSLGLEVILPEESLSVVYTALGINFGGKSLGTEAEVMFSVVTEGAVQESLVTYTITTTSTDGPEILAEAEESFKEYLNASS